MIVFTFRYAIKINDTSTFQQKSFQVVRPQASVSKSEVKTPVCKNQTNSKFHGKGGKFDFFHILMLHRLGYN